MLLHGVQHQLAKVLLAAVHICRKEKRKSLQIQSENSFENWKRRNVGANDDATVFL